MGKKIVVPCLDVTTIAFSSREIYSEVLVLPDTGRVPPGHPIILLKSNKRNIAAVPVKRSICTTYNDSVAMILSDKPNIVSTRERSTRADR